MQDNATLNQQDATIVRDSEETRQLGCRHEPTESTTATARRMSGFGFTHEQIALALGIDPKTLRKHYSEVLAVGAVSASEKIVGALFSKAMRGDVTAQIWWTKARLGWSEKSRHEITGPDGAPIRVDAGIAAIIVENKITEREIVELVKSKTMTKEQLRKALQDALARLEAGGEE